MYANSSIPESAQQGVHEHLAERVARHAGSEFRKPYLDYNKAAFEASLAGWDGKVLPALGPGPVALALTPLAAAALGYAVEGHRIAELLERTLRPCEPREPNPARGPPRDLLRRS